MYAALAVSIPPSIIVGASWLSKVLPSLMEGVNHLLSTNTRAVGHPGVHVIKDKEDEVLFLYSPTRYIGAEQMQVFKHHRLLQANAQCDVFVVYVSTKNVANNLHTMPAKGIIVQPNKVEDLGPVVGAIKGRDGFVIDQQKLLFMKNLDHVPGECRIVRRAFIPETSMHVKVTLDDVYI